MNEQPAKSHEFNVEITWTGGKEGTITPEGKPSLPLTSPLNWDGKPNAYSPHDLFLSAISGCYITTFASMMKRMKQPLQDHKVSGHAKLCQHPEGGWYFTDVYITMEITVPKEAKLPQVKRALNLTEKYCHISRSVASKIHVNAKIHQLD